jgi:hypothetical protein
MFQGEIWNQTEPDELGRLFGTISPHGSSARPNWTSVLCHHHGVVRLLKLALACVMGSLGVLFNGAPSSAESRLWLSRLPSITNHLDKRGIGNERQPWDRMSGSTLGVVRQSTTC